MWPRTTLLSVWSRDAKRLDTPGRSFSSSHKQMWEEGIQVQEQRPHRVSRDPASFHPSGRLLRLLQAGSGKAQAVPHL